MPTDRWGAQESRLRYATAVKAEFLRKSGNLCPSHSNSVPTAARIEAQQGPFAVNRAIAQISQHRLKPAAYNLWGDTTSSRNKRPTVRRR